MRDHPPRHHRNGLACSRRRVTESQSNQAEWSAANWRWQSAIKITEETAQFDLFMLLIRQRPALEGGFTALATDVLIQPDIAVGARHDSPLVVGSAGWRTFRPDVAAVRKAWHTARGAEIDQDPGSYVLRR